MEALGERVELALLQPTPCPDVCNVEVVVAQYARWKNFIWIRGLRSIIKSTKADLVIFPYDVYWLNWVTLVRHKRKIVWFGLGMGKNGVANSMRVQMSKFGSTILYSHKDLNFLVGRGVDKASITVANNTLKVSNPVLPIEKKGKNLLFVGTLDARKNLKSLLDAYHLFLQNSPKSQNIGLQIVGDGPLLAELKKYASLRSLDDNVEFLGRIESESVLRNYYATALASVSYGQIGLTCLQSMANSTPVITCKSAISGGEITNIRHGVNGFLLDDDLDMWSQTFQKLSENKVLLEQLTQQAFDHYWGQRTIDHMASNISSHLSKLVNSKAEG